MVYEEYEEYKPFLPVLLHLAKGCATLDGTRDRKHHGGQVLRLHAQLHADAAGVADSACVVDAEGEGDAAGEMDATGEATTLAARSMATGCTCAWASDRSATLVYRAVYRTGNSTLMLDLKPWSMVYRLKLRLSTAVVET